MPYSEFHGWSVHLLGGSPHAQRRLACFMNVVSADGNMMMKMATQFNAFFDPAKSTSRGYWPTIDEQDPPTHPMRPFAGVVRLLWLCGKVAHTTKFNAVQKTTFNWNYHKLAAPLMAHSRAVSRIEGLASQPGIQRCLRASPRHCPTEGVKGRADPYLPTS